ncbi:MAG: hypothetical protein AAB391_03200 [Patescibacteria group bacterium]
MSILEHDAVKDFMQFVGILLLLGVVWFFNGGKEKALEQRTNVTVTDSSGKVISNTNQTNEGSGGGANGGTKLTPSGIVTAQTNPYSSDEQYKDIENKSRLFKVIRINRPSGAASTDVKQEHITIDYRKTSSFISTESVNITGWMLRSTKSGHQASIGKAVLLPSSYASTAVKGEDEISLRPGDKAIVSTARSPIGNSFLINKCMGHFNQFQTFNPSISEYCPLLRDEKMPLAPNALNDKCLDYINRWPTCGNQIKNLPEYLSHECQVWIADHATYNSCVSLHQPDTDFFSKEWRVFLNRTEPLWKTQREIIQLLDADGKVVDQVSY